MTLVTPTPSWPREKLLGRMDRWIRQTDFEAGIIYGILFSFDYAQDFSYVPRSEKLGKFSVVLINLALQVKYLTFPSSEIHFSSESVIINHHYSILQLYI